MRRLRLSRSRTTALRGPDPFCQGTNSGRTQLPRSVTIDLPATATGEFTDREVDLELCPDGSVDLWANVGRKVGRKHLADVLSGSLVDRGRSGVKPVVGAEPVANQRVDVLGFHHGECLVVSQEVRWAVEHALEKEVWIPVIAQSELALYRSRDPENLSAKSVALMRHGFGGHPLHKK